MAYLLQKQQMAVAESGLFVTEKEVFTVLRFL